MQMRNVVRRSWWVVALFVATAASSDSTSTTSATPAPVVVGKAESAKWSATTYEAAASEANKKVLEGGKAETVTGEVVDVSCWMQLGKRGEAHVACGTKCLQNGQPIGVLEDDEDLVILFAEEHHPRRDGETHLQKVFIPLLSKQVTVSGMMTEMKGYKALFVSAEELGALQKKVEKTTATKKKSS